MRGKAPVKSVERIAEQYDCPAVIVFAPHDGGNQFFMTTYGKTKALCRHPADLGKKFADAVLNGTVAPAAAEPQDMPSEPTVWDGRSSGAGG